MGISRELKIYLDCRVTHLILKIIKKDKTNDALKIICLRSPIQNGYKLSCMVSQGRITAAKTISFLVIIELAVHFVSLGLDTRSFKIKKGHQRQTKNSCYTVVGLMET